VLPDVYGRKAILLGGAILAGVLVVITLIWPLIVPDRSAREVAS
jgi:hypothetical protein